MEKVTLSVTGMTCGGCATSINKALNGYDGVQSSDANADAGTVALNSILP